MQKHPEKERQTRAVEPLFLSKVAFFTPNKKSRGKNYRKNY